MIRWVRPEAVSRLMRIQASPAIQAAQAEGRWIAAEENLQRIGSAEREGLAGWKSIRHPLVAPATFPQEWSPAMLAAAARLTLDLNEALLNEGMELKDATPRNLLFRGSQPIHVDHLSPQERPSGQMGWVAYGQFIRSFLIPLILNQEIGLPLAWSFLGMRDGIPPEMAYRMLGGRAFFSLSLLQLISLPALASRRTRKASAGIRVGDPEVGTAVTRSLLGGLRRHLVRWAPKAPESNWAKYTTTCESYTAEGYEAKRAWVREVLQRMSPSRVLDLGCNTGDHTVSAVEIGASAVAVDLDEAAIDLLWARAQALNADILPVVANLGRPTPALGWRNGEEPPILERLAGTFDAVLALALLHHMLVTERIPLGEILTLLAELTTRDALVEFVGPEDPMFRHLAGPHMGLYTELNFAVFEKEVAKHFELVESFSGNSLHRRMYWLRRR